MDLWGFFSNLTVGYTPVKLDATRSSRHCNCLENITFVTSFPSRRFIKHHRNHVVRDEKTVRGIFGLQTIRQTIISHPILPLVPASIKCTESCQLETSYISRHISEVEAPLPKCIQANIPTAGLPCTDTFRQPGPAHAVRRSFGWRSHRRKQLSIQPGNARRWRHATV